MIKQNQTFKIYRDGSYRRSETYLPVLKARLVGLANKIDYWLVNNEWPSEIPCQDIDSAV